MVTDRTETAVKRIEAALSRIAVVADAVGAETPAREHLPEDSSIVHSALRERHTDLRTAATKVLEDLDSLIDGMEK